MVRPRKRLAVVVVSIHTHDIGTEAVTRLRPPEGGASEDDSDTGPNHVPLSPSRMVPDGMSVVTGARLAALADIWM